MSMSLSQARVVDAVLTRHAQGYRSRANVGMALFPRVPVTLSGGQIIEFSREAFVRHNSTRAPGTNTKRIPMGYFGRPYQLRNHALDAAIPREIAKDAKQQVGVDLAMRGVDVTMRSLTLGLEVEQAEIARNPSNYPATHRILLAPGARWTDAGVDPATTIDAGMEAIRTATGMYPNVMLLPSRVYRALRRNAAARALFGGSDAGAIGPAQIAAAFDIERVVVAGAVQATTAEPIEGPAPASIFSDVWGTDVILAYAPQNPSGIEEPSFGYTYTMEGHPYVEPPRWDGDTKSWIAGVSYERVPVLSGISAGYIIQTAVAP
jgi:hypothetical protein